MILDPLCVGKDLAGHEVLCRVGQPTLFLTEILGREDPGPDASSIRNSPPFVDRSAVVIVRSPVL